MSERDRPAPGELPSRGGQQILATTEQRQAGVPRHRLLRDRVGAQVEVGVQRHRLRDRVEGGANASFRVSRQFAVDWRPDRGTRQSPDGKSNGDNCDRRAAWNLRAGLGRCAWRAEAARHCIRSVWRSVGCIRHEPIVTATQSDESVNAVIRSVAAVLGKASRRSVVFP